MSPPRALRRLRTGPRAGAKFARSSPLAALAFGALAGCTPSPQAQPAPAPAVSSAPSRPQPLPPPPAAATPSVRFEQGEPLSVRFVGDLLGLADGTRLSREDFAQAALGVQGARARTLVEQQRLLILLDEQTPRPLLAPSVPLASIVDEDRELGPGWHVLAVVVTGGAGVEVHVVRFLLELDGLTEEVAPGCALLAPGGTVRAAAEEGLELVGVPLSAAVRRFDYFVAGAGGASLRVPGLQAARVHGLVSGDHVLGVRCYEASGALVGESQRTVTLNRRAAQEAAEKDAAP